MSGYDDVLRDLRLLRRSKRNRPIDFKNTPDLVWHLGRGNIDVTTRFLHSLRSLDDVEVLAALASLGFEGYDQSIEDRMNDFAFARNEESTRTVRRWADEGFKKIANLVIEWSEEAGHDSTLVEILLQQVGQLDLKAIITGSGPPGIRMLVPRVSVNYTALPSQPMNEDIEGVDHPVYFRWTVDAELGAEAAIAAILEAEWLGNFSTRYEVQVHPSIRDYVTSSIVTKKGCEVQLIRLDKFPMPGEGPRVKWTM